MHAVCSDEEGDGSEDGELHDGWSLMFCAVYSGDTESDLYCDVRFETRRLVKGSRRDMTVMEKINRGGGYDKEL